jgi:hypothetical protein
MVMSNEAKKRFFIISSLTVKDSSEYLAQQPEESFHLMSGVVVDGIIVLERIIPIKPEYRSIGGWKGDPLDTIKKLLYLDDYEHALLCTWHIHPSKGMNATLPSREDCNYQMSLEKGGYQAIMAIFSRDGFFRFFNIKNDFEIRIYGKGVESVEEQAKLFKISKTNDISWPED